MLKISERFEGLMKDYPYRVPVKQAALLLDMSEQVVRCGLRAQRFSFGTAIQGDSGRWTYHIPTGALIHYLTVGNQEVAS